MENNFWEEPNLTSQVKLENHIRYSGAGNSEDEEYGFHGNKKKLARDPLSHRIIEKRRRDRMNSCLADLSRLIPLEYMKKGRGRVEKTEVIEMAIKRIKHLMSHTNCKDSECGQEKAKQESEDSQSAISNRSANVNQNQFPDTTEHLATSYRLGFIECLSETIHFLVQVEGLMSTDPFCSHLKAHLSNHCDNILQSESLRSRLCFSNEVKSEQNSNVQQSEQVNSFDIQDTRTNQLSCIQPDTGSETSTVHTNNLSPTSSNSEKTHTMVMETVPSYKFKNRIQKRFEKGGAGPPRIVDKSTRVPVFVLAPGGAHYLATWLEAATIPGYVELNIGGGEPPTGTAHHPVTISVDFRPRIGTI